MKNIKKRRRLVAVGTVGNYNYKNFKTESKWTKKVFTMGDEIKKVVIKRIVKRRTHYIKSIV